MILPEIIVYPDNGAIAYVMLGRDIYFTGIVSSRKATSTINAAEKIVTAICNQENISWKHYAFYDIQTHKGYESKQKGEYDVDLLVIEESEAHPDNITISAWLSQAKIRKKLPPNANTPLDEKIFQIFQAYIVGESLN